MEPAELARLMAGVEAKMLAAISGAASPEAAARGCTELCRQRLQALHRQMLRSALPPAAPRERWAAPPAAKPEANSPSSSWSRQSSVDSEEDVAEAAKLQGALFQAASEGRLNVVRMICHSGFDVNCPETGLSPLRAAVHSNHLEVVRFLCEARADLEQADAEGATSLHAAALGGHVAVASLLMDYGADPDSLFHGQGSKYRSPPVSFAIDRGHAEASRLFARRGVGTSWGLPPLAVAAGRRDLHLLRRLLEGRQDPNVTDTCGGTPLYLPAITDDAACAEALLEARADVRHANEDGRSALAIACQLGSLNVARLLLRAGAEPHAAAPDGLSPFDLAAKFGHDAALQRILEDIDRSQGCG